MRVSENNLCGPPPPPPPILLGLGNSFTLAISQLNIQKKHVVMCMDLGF